MGWPKKQTIALPQTPIIQVSLTANPELLNGVHCLSALYLVGNLLNKIIEFQTVPCHSFLFVHILKNITSWFNPFPSVPFDSFSFRTKLNTNYLRFIPFLFVPFHFLALSQTVYSPSTRCLYFCLLFRITVNYAELGINVHTSPKNIRSQNISLPHNRSGSKMY